MKNKPVFLLAGLGLCEYCGTLISVEGMPPDALDADWACPKCEKILGGKSFGYNEKNEKVEWVGPGGKWTKQKPTQDFDLGNWHIIAKAPRLGTFF